MRLFFAILSLSLFSCDSKTAVPAGVLPAAQMTDVLWDVMLADGLVSYRYPSAREADKLDTSVVLYQQIAKAHGTTQQQLKKSLQFYESRPDLLQVIIDSLQKRSMTPAAAFNADTGRLKKDSLSRKLFRKPMVPPALP
jgi:hypothetical protein